MDPSHGHASSLTSCWLTSSNLPCMYLKYFVFQIISVHCPQLVSKEEYEHPCSSQNIYATTAIGRFFGHLMHLMSQIFTEDGPLTGQNVHI